MSRSSTTLKAAPSSVHEAAGGLIAIEGVSPADLTAIDAVTPHPENPREGDIGGIMESIRAHGIYRRLVIQRETPNGENRMRVIAGNHTRQAAKELGYRALPMEFVVCTDAKARKILAADNRTSDRASYNNDALAELLRSIATDDPEGLEGTAWDGDDLDTLIAELGIQQNGNGGDPDDVDLTPPEEPKSKRGEIYELGPHRLMCGDSTNAEDVAQLMAGNRANIGIMDPPYGADLDNDWSDAVGSLGPIGASHGTRGNKYERTVGDDAPFDPAPIFASFDYLAELFLWGADYYAERIPRRTEGSWLVWDKRKVSQAEAIGSEFELCWSKAKHKRRMLRHDWFGFLSSQNATEARNRLHANQKPTSLICDILEQWSERGARVVDLYGGSGTTMIAADMTGRVAYLMEILPRNCDVIRRRYAEHVGRPELAP